MSKDILKHNLVIKYMVMTESFFFSNGLFFNSQISSSRLYGFGLGDGAHVDIARSRFWQAAKRRTRANE